MRPSVRVVLPAVLLLSACTAQVPVHEPTIQHQTTSASVSSAPAPKPVVDTPNYTHAKDGFKLWLPSGWIIKENATSPLTYRKSAGTALITPDEYAKDTTFLSGIVFVERTRTPCAQFVNSVDVTLGDKAFSKGDSTTMGTKYTQRSTMYTIIQNKACYSIMLTVRTCSTGTGCSEQHLNSFDPTDLNETFDRIVASFQAF